MDSKLNVWTEMYGIHVLEIGPKQLRVHFQIDWKKGEGGTDSGYRVSINKNQSHIVFKTVLEAKQWAVNMTKNNLLLRLENMLIALKESLANEEENTAHAYTS